MSAVITRLGEQYHVRNGLRGAFTFRGTDDAATLETDLNHTNPDNAVILTVARRSGYQVSGSASSLWGEFRNLVGGITAGVEESDGTWRAWLCPSTGSPANNFTSTTLAAPLGMWFVHITSYWRNGFGGDDGLRGWWQPLDGSRALEQIDYSGSGSAEAWNGNWCIGNRGYNTVGSPPDQAWPGEIAFSAIRVDGLIARKYISTDAAEAAISLALDPAYPWEGMWRPGLVGEAYVYNERTAIAATRRAAFAGGEPKLWEGPTRRRLFTMPRYVATASPNVFIRPTADVTDGSWLNEAESATDLFASVDEASPSDTDWIYSSSGTPDVAEVALGDPGGTPEAGTVTLRVRHNLRVLP